MLEIVDDLAQLRLPGEHERLRSALLTDQNGMLTATRLRLARIARARGVDTNAVDDVVQETLLEAWSHLDRLTSPAGFQPWIDEICRNVCRRYARRLQENLLRYTPVSRSYQDNESSSGEDDLSLLTNILDPNTPDPLEALSRQELVLLLDRALGLLPQESRMIVEMCHLLELPQSEVAERLGISTGALYTRLHRARRHLRQILQGPLYQEAASLGLVLEQEEDGEWFETQIWCSSCGHYRLQGSFFETESGETVKLHARCPGCSSRYGLDTVHSMGMVSLGGPKTFRPAFKRTMQGLAGLVMQALAEGDPPCPWCGYPSSLQVADAKAPGVEAGGTPPLGPYRYWICWTCLNCGELVYHPGCLPSVDQMVCWSDPRTRQFMAQHPHWLSTTGTPLEFAGQPALSFQITDVDSAASLTVLAHRETLRVLI